VTDMTEIMKAGSDRIRGLSAAVAGDASYVAASTTWMPLGACQGEDPELFFPIAVRGPALRQINAARAVCRGCAVAVMCLTYALETGQAGIWGGTTWEERRVMPKPHRVPASDRHASPAFGPLPC
jgi:WhiB family transcriptional regulator, redox-sensing transcriptional regulator